MNVEINWRVWKMRLVGWARDAILILGMWSIWLTREYTIDLAIKNVITGFQITIIVIVVLIKEYIVSVDSSVIELESELNRLKNNS